MSPATSCESSNAYERAARHFWLPVFVHWKFFVAVIGASLATALFLYHIAEPQYEHREGIVIGRILHNGNIQTIERRHDALPRLRQQYAALESANPDVRLLKPFSITSSRRDLIYLVARGGDADAVQQFLRKPLSDLVLEHSTALNKSLEDIARRKSAIQSQLTTFAEKTAQRDADLARQRTSLTSQLETLVLLEAQHEPTRFLRVLTSPQSPVRPDLQLYLTIALMLAITLGSLGTSLRARHERLKS